LRSSNKNNKKYKENDNNDEENNDNNYEEQYNEEDNDQNIEEFEEEDEEVDVSKKYEKTEENKKEKLIKIIKEIFIKKDKKNEGIHLVDLTNIITEKYDFSKKNPKTYVGAILNSDKTGNFVNIGNSVFKYTPLESHHNNKEKSKENGSDFTIKSITEDQTSLNNDNIIINNKRKSIENETDIENKTPKKKIRNENFNINNKEVILLDNEIKEEEIDDPNTNFYNENIILQHEILKRKELELELKKKEIESLENELKKKKNAPTTVDNVTINNSNNDQYNINDLDFLERLFKLKEKGLLTEAEFEIKRKKILKLD
jgi:hypothetical protein